MTDETTHTQEEHIDTPTNDHASCDEKLAEAVNGWKRAQADYANLQRDVARERMEMGAFATARVVQEFLVVYDHFKRALTHVPSEVANDEMKNWLVGVTAIRDLFAQSLKQFQITDIETRGQPFDPVCMEAVGEHDAPNVSPHTVVEEVEGGYKMGERILKPAKVILAKSN